MLTGHHLTDQKRIGRPRGTIIKDVSSTRRAKREQLYYILGITEDDVRAMPMRQRKGTDDPPVFRRQAFYDLEIGEMVESISLDTGLTDVQVFYAITLAALREMKKVRLSSRWTPPDEGED